ncbi:hypothetical protein CBL_11740 [Carabus blaptoides fortunei]
MLPKFINNAENFDSYCRHIFRTSQCNMILIFKWLFCCKSNLKWNITWNIHRTIYRTKTREIQTKTMKRAA